jgi:crotonobetainyl-CoA:carnitine CoA-transferase CaiB-like acyl-CoA transferase
VPPERELRAGDGHSTTKAGPAFHECYRASDGWFYLQADLPSQWERLAKEIDAPGLLDDPRFSTESARSANKDVLDAILNEWLKDRTKEEAFEILGGAGVPCSPAYSAMEVANHPYLRERGIVQEIEDPRLGRMSVLTPRIQFAGEHTPTPQYAPLLGEHNEEVFGGLLGMDAGKLQALRDKAVI